MIIAPLVQSDCNWAVSGGYPFVVDVCSARGKPSYMATCYSSYALVTHYDSTDCSGDITNITFAPSYSCNNTGDCDSIAMYTQLHTNGDCSDDAVNDGTFYLAPLVDQCISVFSGGGVYASLTVSTSGINWDLTYSSTCASTVQTLTFTNNECYTGSSGNSTYFTFSEITLSPVTTQEPNYGNCNYAFVGDDTFPFIDGTCNSGGGGSTMIECASDSNSAIIRHYDDYQCSGNITNQTSASNFYCDAANDGYDCEPVTMLISLYFDNIECSNQVESAVYGIWYFPSFEEECIRYNLNSGAFAYLFLKYTIDSNGFFVSTYFDNTCAGTAYGSFNITNDRCYNNNDGNSTGYQFLQDTTAAPTTTTTATTADISTTGSITTSGTTSGTIGVSGTDGNINGGSTTNSDEDNAIFYAQRCFTITIVLFSSLGINMAFL